VDRPAAQTEQLNAPIGEKLPGWHAVHSPVNASHWEPVDSE
jgi:hypothetical protein